MVLLSKELVTIDTDVAVDFDPEKMLAQAPDPEAARALFTELEFNTLTREFLTESVELGETDYRDATSAKRMSKQCWPRCARIPAACLPSRWRVRRTRRRKYRRRRESTKSRTRR